MMYYIESIQQFVENEYGYMLYILALICLVMVLDLVFASIVAKVLGTQSSKIGINGMLRKIASIMMLVSVLVFIPIIPFEMGVYAVTIFYLNYLRLEVVSLGETYSLINGNEAGVLKNLTDLVVDLFTKKYKDK